METFMRIATMLACAAAIVGAASDRSSAEPDRSSVTKIAVFGFELQDVSPAGALGKPTTSDASLQKATTAAREELASSGRYGIVSIDDADAKPGKGRALGDCDGCEAPVALKLGAQQSMIGIVQRVTQTDYYVVLVIRDASTGKIVNAQSANFAGGEEGWASGVRRLIKRQVLAQ
jgi:hypothetical protein